MNETVVQQAGDFYLDEIKDHVTYLTLAGNERNPELRAMLGHVATIELRHSDYWKAFLETRGLVVPAQRISRARLLLLKALQKLMSSALLVSLLELGEANAFRTYFTYLHAAKLNAQEKDELRAIILDELEHELTFRKESERRGGGHIRDFVLGMNDGLVEILGAVTGLSAVYAANPLIVAVSGLIVGIAGAMSMGIGAFVSVRSQRQVNEARRERMEILFEVAPKRAIAEYCDQLADSGVPQDAAADIAQRVGTNRDAIARLLLHDTTENEFRSGLFTGLAYLFGVFFPVVPYFVARDSLMALVGSIVFAGVALASTATAVSVLSGISLTKKATEMLTAGFGAALIAYIFGKAVQWLFGAQL